MPNDLAVIDPSTEEICGTISLAGTADVHAAVAAARAAFPSWSTAPVADRIGVLERLTGLYQAHQNEISKAMTAEMGAPVDYSANTQFDAGRVHLEETLRVLKEFRFEEIRGKDRIFREAGGVCALITPWNWPMNQVILKVAPALAAGCTMVLKPSEIAPLSSIIFANLVHQAGCPAGVFNMVNGDGAGTGAALTTHRDVDMISFTGSTRAACLISRAAADSVKRVALELGGKGANLIFDDATDDAVERGVLHCFENAGQSCDAPTRMLVQRGRYDSAVAEAARIAENHPCASAHQSGDHMGPLVSDTHRDKVQRLIRAGIAEGARLVAGGPGHPDGLDRGYFVKPTVFADVNNGMVIAREEVFGPVLSILPFDTEQEAIAIANDTPYGLGNYIQTRDRGRAARVARALRSGSVSINGAVAGVDMPFGGYKRSGIGREGSVFGLEAFLEIKAVCGA